MGSFDRDFEVRRLPNGISLIFQRVRPQPQFVGGEMLNLLTASDWQEDAQLELTDIYNELGTDFPVESHAYFPVKEGVTPSDVIEMIQSALGQSNDNA